MDCAEVEEEECEKRKFLYDFAKNIYSDEAARFKGLEDKSARYFGFLSILIGLLTAFVRLSDHRVIADLDGILSWIYLVLMAVAYIAMANCGRLLFEALKPRLLAIIDLNPELNEYYSGQKLTSIYSSIIDDLMEATSAAREINKDKCKSINKAHKELGVSLATTAMLIMIYPFL